jgi:hypothetical protein
MEVAMTNEDQESSPPENCIQDGSGRVAQSGDCCHSIACEAGHFWKAVWAANSGLQESRRPNQLVPGDVIHVPPIEPKEIERPTGKRHVFQRTGALVRLRLRLVRGGRALAKERYVLRVGLRSFSGRTDGEGMIDRLIPAVAQKAILEVPGFAIEAGLRIGSLPPADTIPGMQSRLRNLGYGCDLSGESDAGTVAAVKSFQTDQRLEASGNPEPETKATLMRQHGT